MTARTHDIFAFATLITVITVAAYYPPSSLKIATLIVALVANIIGSLLPDIDQASSRLWDLFPGGDFVGRVMKNIFLSHRALSHSLLGIYLTCWLTGWVLPRIFNSDFINPGQIQIALMIGYASHLVLDGFTEEGLPLLFPLKIKFGFPPISQWRIETGKWFEKLVVFPGIIIYLFWFAFRNQEKLLQIVKSVILSNKG